MKLQIPASKDDLKKLKIGDTVYLTGNLYTGRDAAHKRLVALVEENKPLPIDIEGQAIYYVGPTPAKPGEVIGSAGPTSSYRMDPYSPVLMEKGLRLMIGKGPRSDAFKEEMLKTGSVYLSAVGGAAALISKTIKEAKVVAYEDLGAEAIYALYVEDFPVVVTYDSHGGDLFKEGIAKYKRL